MRAERPAPFFIADDVSLDFLNSVCAPWGTTIEWIETGDDLLCWLVAAQLMTELDAKFLRQRFPERELDATAQRARQLREQFRMLIAQIADGGYGVGLEKLLKPINELLASSSRNIQLALATQQGRVKFHQQPLRRWTNLDELLALIAEAMVHLLCSGQLESVKQCEGPTCTLWFLDVSKNRKRRWCTMTVCGNRAKAAAFRAKQKEKNCDAQ